MAKKEYPPDDDTVYLYIENPVGMAPGTDFRKRDSANLYFVSQWLHFMAWKLNLPSPLSIWVKPNSTFIIVPMDLPRSDEARLHCLLGVHVWRKFIRPRGTKATKAIYGEDLQDFGSSQSTVFMCAFQNADRISIERTCSAHPTAPTVF